MNNPGIEYADAQVKRLLPALTVTRNGQPDVCLHITPSMLRDYFAVAFMEGQISALKKAGRDIAAMPLTSSGE